MTVRASYRVELGLGDYDAFISERADPIARWKLNEPIGAEFADSSPSGSFPLDSLTFGPGDPQTGTQSPYATDMQGVTFSGAEILHAGVVALSWLTGGSMAGWFRTSYTGAEQTIASKMTFDGKGWRITVQTNGKIRFLMQNNVPTTILDVSTNNAYNDGEWHRYYLTWTGTNSANGFKWYVDGVLDRQSTASATAPAANGDPVLVGAYSSSALLMFHGSLFDITMYDVVQPAATIQSDFTAAQWTDVSDDVMANGIRYSRGIAGGTPVDLVARPGSFTFDLDNSDANTAGLVGYYSPDHANVRAGWAEQIPVRLVATYNDIDYPLWRGRVLTILPTAGENLERLVHVNAEGCLGPFLRQRLKAILPVVGESEDVLIETLTKALPENAWPPGMNIEAGVLTVSYAFEQIGDGSNGFTVLQQIAQSAYGRIFEAADGSLSYRSISHSGLGTATHTVDDDVIAGSYAALVVPSSFGALYDRVRGTIHPKTVGDVTTDVIYTSPTIIEVAASSTITFWVNYADPDNTLKLIGAVDWQSPTATTDYLANSQADGLGSNLTGSVTVSAQFYGSSALVTIINAAGSTAFFVNGSGDPFFQLRGRRIIDDGTRAVESDSSNPYATFDPEGQNWFEIDFAFLDDYDLAKSRVQFIAANFRGVHVEQIPLDPQTDETELLAALQVEVGDTWAATESVTGVTGKTVILQGFDGEVIEQDILNLVARTYHWADLFVVP